MLDHLNVDWNVVERVVVKDRFGPFDVGDEAARDVVRRVDQKDRRRLAEVDDRRLPVWNFKKTFLGFFFLKKMVQTRYLFHFFLSFQTNITILTTNKCKKYPSSIRCRDSNSQPSDYDLTTRPRLPSFEYLDDPRKLFSRRRWTTVTAVSCSVFNMSKTLMHNIHCNVPYVFYYWADPVVHLSPQRSSMCIAIYIPSWTECQPLWPYVGIKK